MTMDRGQYDRIRKMLIMPGPPGKDGRIWSYCPLHGDGAKSGRRPTSAPGRNDAGRSLSLHPEFGLNCHAGCTRKGSEDDFKALMEALEKNAPVELQERRRQRERVPPPQRQPKAPAGPGWRDPDTGRHIKGIPEHAKLVAVYQYVDPSGRILALKGRWEWADIEAEKGYGKTFRWWREGTPIASGLNDGGPQVPDMPLWGHDLVRAAPSSAPVWFVEGENAALALRARGEIAVCLSQGASATEWGDALEVLRGRTVRLWPDNDEKGRELMMRVHRALKPLTRVITVINAPVGPKGDAVDYFAAGGTLEALLDNLLEAPAVSILSDEHFLIRIPTEVGTFAFDFDSMEQERRELTSELTVTSLVPSTTHEAYSLRINLESASARESLVRELTKHFALGRDFNWTQVVSQAYSRARTSFLAVERGSLATDLPEPGPEMWLIDRLLVKGMPNLVFGDGGAGKSFFTATLGVAVAWGMGEIIGHRVNEMGPVLYIDWETASNPAGFKRRMRRIYAGLGLQAVEGEIQMHYWPSKGQPLSAMVAPLKRYIDKHGIVLVIIDSAMPACGGSPEDAVVALSFFSAITKLGNVTSLIISHVSKESIKDGKMPDRAYGNQVWHNQPRTTWYLRAGEAQNGVADVLLLQRKANDSSFAKPIGLKVDYGGEGHDNGPVSYERGDVREMPDFDALTPPWERAIQFIQEQPVGMAITKDISEPLGMSVTDTYRMLASRAASRANGERGLFRKMGGREGSAEQKWAVNAHPEGIAG